jgi:MYXO-CTERM domain-containing protein
VTTLTHTGVILAVALALPLVFPDAPPATVQLVLGLVGGLLIAGVGLWLLMQRLAGRADHVHIGRGHSHSHGAGDDPPAPPPPGWWGVIALGVSGGIVPCWDAILIPAVCVAARRPELALPLVLAFSAGLAGVLVVLGLVVVRAREMAGGLLESGRARTVTRLLPIASAAVIVGLGLWLCWESVRLAPVG